MVGAGVVVVVDGFVGDGDGVSDDVFAQTVGGQEVDFTDHTH